MITSRKLFLLVSALIILPVISLRADSVHPEKIVMVWDYIGKKQDNQAPDKKIVHKGLDVVSPTWFSIKNRNGDVSSFADKGYVQWAHDNALEIWALFENKSDTQLTSRVLSSAAARKKMIGQITGFVREYKLDGINIDFEALSQATGKYFEQFIIELYKELKPLKVTLSVDIPFPVSEIQTIYSISLIADNSDYVVMMAYDQHYEGSKAIGPTAAINWVKRGIEETLNYVSHNKIILGIPFYTRVWIEDQRSGEVKTSSELRGMKDAFEMFDGISSIWRRGNITEQIYAEFERDTKRYKVWLEDDISISLKLDVINDYDLAGMSAWRRGWEWNETWDIINEHFK